MPHPATESVKEKDLRLALVCYGGISLAVYQHGITKEILKLVRASKACHAGRQPEYTGSELDTEAVYADLLKTIRANHLDLRVIVDVIAGSSAGGINGVVLARAIAHDLPVAPLTDMWLADADITRVLAAEARARFWQKWYVRPLIGPLIRLLNRKRMLPLPPDRETRTKLSLFLRSRWFQPPFDGQGFCGLLLDALGGMGEPLSATASLMPTGHRLDLLVTVTDFYGTERPIYIHDPPIVWEREHRHIFRFAFEQFQGGAVQTDFDLYNVPSLAFAARATASFPGAFPPVQIHEMDAALKVRSQSWPARDQFLRSNFRHYHEFGMNPEHAVFVDGSVLNNKPVFEAIETASTHVAFRQVDRRLIYIDPHPAGIKKPAPETVPGFAHAITGALSDLPRYEPINSELARIEAFNANVLRLQEAIDAATPRVRRQVGALVWTQLDQTADGRPVDAAQMRRWRLQLAHQVSEQEPLLHAHYMQLMIGAGLDYLTALVCAICGYPHGSPRAHWAARVLRLWARHGGIYQEDYGIAPGVTADAELPAFARFVESFDLNFRRRRLQFLMRTTNRLYNRLDEPACEGTPPAVLDGLKRRLYRQLDALREYHRNDFLRAQTLSHARALFGRRDALPDTLPDTIPEAGAFAMLNRYEIGAVIEQIGLECDFARFSNETDEIMGSPEVQGMAPPLRRELVETYLGFGLWDAVSFPMLSMKDADEALQLTELHEIIVDRISPDDATTFADRGPVLKGSGFGGFAGFFNRSARENDYLWGRLHAVDRLLDILASAVAPDMPEGFDMVSFRKRAFEIVLRAEAARLPNVRDVIEELQQRLANSD